MTSVTAADDFADFADSRPVCRPRAAPRPPCQTARSRQNRVSRRRPSRGRDAQTGDGHRRLALAVDLGEDGPNAAIAFLRLSTYIGPPP